MARTTPHSRRPELSSASTQPYYRHPEHDSGSTHPLRECAHTRRQAKMDLIVKQ